ncbi:hypothetical protein [Niveispirillum sp.]|uniref:hypothetical protein n=1 Tax=Niveispirillum sp. TaxID=1917217 RepID=UPI001B49EE19|nr:hypothetical protein [Niveispirillum sp.]MBP7334811.1 hypothetical protein [Niveispirillum sp.]
MKKHNEALLAQQIAPVDRMQKALTNRFITPLHDEIFRYLYNLREELDPDLRARYPQVSPGKPYPLGRCTEITETVLSELRRRLARPAAPAERAMAAFVKSGGILRPIWGALRGQFFQNATQLGAFYVDVANDTVTVTKPKVEILPLDQAGMENVRDLAHFSEIAGKYWKARIVANHVAPSLAPLLPMVALFDDNQARLVSVCDYMIGMMMRDRFTMAEQWVTAMPSPPDEVISHYRARLPDSLRPADGVDGRQAAIDACRAARQAGQWKSQPWLTARMVEIGELVEL